MRTSSSSSSSSYKSNSSSSSSLLKMPNKSISMLLTMLIMSIAPFSSLNSASAQNLEVHEINTLSLKEPECNYVVEVFHLQDFSASFYDDLSELQIHLPAFLSDLNATFPGSIYGVGTFVDKPLPPLGMPYEGEWFEGDWCLNVTSPIASSEPSVVSDILLSGLVGAGFDDPENQIGALHDIALNAGLVGWTDRVVDERGYPVVRVISLSTDATYHVAPEGIDAFPNVLRPNDGDMTTECAKEDYPSVEQTGNALRQRNAYTIVLIGSERGNQENTPVLQVYRKLLADMNVYGDVYPLDDRSSDFIAAMTTAFDEMAELTCSKPALDVVFSHDVTYSYKNDLPMLQDRIANVTLTLQNEYTAPRFALTTFGDKPMLPLGHEASGDYCFKLHEALTYDRQAVLDATSNVRTTSGVDWKESQLDGVISSVLEPTMGWRLGEMWNGFQMIRVIVLATDSGFHTATDAAGAGYPLAPHAGGMVKCLIEEYPSLEQLAQALLEHDVHPLFVPTKDIAGIYRRLLKYLEENYSIVGVVSELDDFGQLSEVVPKGIRRLKTKLDNRKKDGHGKQHNKGHGKKHNKKQDKMNHHRDSDAYNKAPAKEVITG